MFGKKIVPFNWARPWNGTCDNQDFSELNLVLIPLTWLTSSTDHCPSVLRCCWFSVGKHYISAVCQPTRFLSASFQKIARLVGRVECRLVRVRTLPRGSDKVGVLVSASF